MAQYNFDKTLNTKNFEIAIDTTSLYGYFEHQTYGEELGGGLWFDASGELIDYDGVYELPKEVATALKENGYFGGGIEDAFEENV
jgi:hypothetical protein